MADRGIARHSNPRAGTLSRLAALVAVLLLILAACGPTAGSPAASASATPSLTPAATAEVTASPAATASPDATPEPTQVAVGECTPDAPTALTQNWVAQASLSGDYRFARPAEWADLSADVTLPTNISVSPGTFTETGLPADSQIQVDAVRSFDGNVLVTAWVVEGVTTRTEDLFDRELAWLKTQPQIKAVLDEELETCIGGSRARGFSSTWASGGVEKFIVMFLLQRNGKMYEVQLTAADPNEEVTFREVLNSWQFTEPLEAPGPTDLDDEFAATDFKLIGMSATLDDTGDVPNASTFQSVFPAMSERIYVLYELDDGAAETVNFSWAQGGRELFTNSFDYKTTTTFAWGWMTPPSSGRFATGDYSVTLSLEDSGDTITVPFTVE